MGKIYHEDGIEFELFKRYERKDEWKAKEKKKKFYNKGYYARIRHFYDSKGKRTDLGLLVSTSLRKGFEKPSISEFISKKFKQNEWYYFSDIEEKVLKDGYTKDQWYSWKYNVEKNQTDNNTFETSRFIIKTKGGVMGAEGLRGMTKHAKLSFYPINYKKPNKKQPKKSLDIDPLSNKILIHLKKQKEDDTYQVIVDLGFSEKTGGKIRYRLNKLEEIGLVKKSGRLSKGYSGHGRSKRFYVWSLTDKGFNYVRKFEPKATIHKNPSKILKEVLEKTLKNEGIYKNVLDMYIKQFISEGKAYILFMNDKNRKGRAPRGQTYAKYSNGKYILDKEQIKRTSEWYANQIVKFFIEKNVGKVQPILLKRKDLVRITLRDVNINRGQIEANHTLIFSNADEFTLRSQVVFVWATSQRKEHHRYPSTFHDIMIKGNFYKSKSQKFIIDNI